MKNSIGGVNMIRVLHVVAGMGLGGTETYLMNIYRNIDREKVQFDFLTYYEEGESGYYDDEIIKMGGKIHNISSVTKAGFIRFINEIQQVLRNGNYTVIHAHTTHNIGFTMFAAKLENINIRIAHAHNTKVGGNVTVIQKMYRKIMYIWINRYANKFCACSAKASEHLFTSKNIEKNYTYLPNSVDLDPFVIKSSREGKSLKEVLKIPKNSKIIGHVGRYGKAKNHEFIITMFNTLLQKRKDLYLILIGDGATRSKIETQIKKLGIQEHIKILGLRSDVVDLMQIMDVFILPSLYEGFGLVLLEAQASGLPCIVSENIQPEPDMNLGLMHWVDLQDIDKWMRTIEENLDKKILDKNLITAAIEKSPFKIERVVEQFYDLYELNKEKVVCE